MSIYKLAAVPRSLGRNLFANNYLFGSRLLINNVRFFIRANKPLKDQSKEIRKTLVTGVGIGIGLGVVSAVYSSIKSKDAHMVHEESEIFVIDQLPDVQITRKIVNPADKSNLDLVLFQYQTCPFCCKVRAFLDSSGLSYSIVEVDAVLRQGIKWSPYKKVPMLLARTKDGKYVQLTESSMIISALSSYLLDPTIDIEELAKIYPRVSYMDDNGKKKHDVLNKYFKIFGENTPKDLTQENLETERKWREWTDNQFIHLISPNVYRTSKEALETFEWFSDAGEWDRHFPHWERNLMVYVGATAMYLISKRLKKRHNLDKDVRKDIYNACNQWTNELKNRKTKFLGGAKPNLADLALYGAITSMEGCQAFSDILSNTDIEPWFRSMKAHVNANKGTVITKADWN